ncbi:hypothetical protein IC575_024101 [Cucumis melo]
MPILCAALGCVPEVYMSVHKTIRLISWEYFPFNFLSSFFLIPLYQTLHHFNGFFLKVNKSTLNMLHIVEHYVTYVLSRSLKLFALKILWPFKLKAPLGGLKKKTILILRNLRKRRRKEQEKKLCKNLNKIRFPFSTTFFLVLY